MRKRPRPSKAFLIRQARALGRESEAIRRGSRLVQARQRRLVRGVQKLARHADEVYVERVGHVFDKRGRPKKIVQKLRGSAGSLRLGLGLSIPLPPGFCECPGVKIGWTASTLSLDICVLTGCSLDTEPSIGIYCEYTCYTIFELLPP